MNASELKHYARSRAEPRGVDVQFGQPATADALRRAEASFGVPLTRQFVALYSEFDGLMVPSPAFVVLPLEELVARSGKVLFARAGDRAFALDISSKNTAGEWSVIDCSSNRTVTLTLASFWSTQMWKWILEGRPFW